MAGPITHIVLAIKILTLLPSAIDKAQFIVGTSFPDIRYEANISREATHIEPVSWKDIRVESDSFRAGMLFHNLVDILRLNHFEQEFFDRYNMSQYTVLERKLIPALLKIAEDAFLYDQIDNWEEIARYFDDIYQQELDICSDVNIIRKWHTMLQTYFREQSPVDRMQVIVKDVLGLKFLAFVTSIDATFNTFLADAHLKTQITKFYNNFATLLSDEPLMLLSESESTAVSHALQLAYS